MVPRLQAQRLETGLEASLVVQGDVGGRGGGGGCSCPTIVVA